MIWSAIYLPKTDNGQNPSMYGFKSEDDVYKWVDENCTIDVEWDVDQLSEQEIFKRMMRELKLNFHDIARITGHSYQSVKTMLQPNGSFPRWGYLVLYVWEGWQKET